MIIETRDFRLSLIHEVACNEEEDVIFRLIQNHSERRRLLDQVVRTTSAEGSSGEGLLRDAQNTSQARARE